MKTNLVTARRIAELTESIAAADRRVAAECAHAAETDRPVTCGSCGKSWPADIFPAARCPYEYEHDAIAELATLTRKANADTRYMAESIVQLRAWLPPGATVYNVLTHVSRSGMSRRIKPYVILDGRPQWIGWKVAKVLGMPLKDDAIIVGGCGMDMGFALVYDLSRTLYPQGFKVDGVGRNGDTSGHDRDGGYALQAEWL